VAVNGRMAAVGCQMAAVREIGRLREANALASGPPLGAVRSGSLRRR
jgi:hypothetical protein